MDGASETGAFVVGASDVGSNEYNGVAVVGSSETGTSVNMLGFCDDTADSSMLGRKEGASDATRTGLPVVGPFVSRGFSVGSTVAGDVNIGTKVKGDFIGAKVRGASVR